MQSEVIQIVSNRNNGRLVNALLVEDPTDRYIEATDKLWRVYRKRFVDALKATGKPIPDHNHWSWKWKLEQELAKKALFKCFAILSNNEPQGLLLLNYGQEYTARLQEQRGQPLLYVAYIESAPWNVPGYCDAPCFSGIGTLLYKASVEFSIRLGFAGRVGLHALPNVEKFYANRCRMRDCGKDQSHDGLVYFESTPKDSLAFLKDAERR